MAIAVNTDERSDFLYAEEGYRLKFPEFSPHGGSLVLLDRDCRI